MINVTSKRAVDMHEQSYIYHLFCLAYWDAVILERENCYFARVGLMKGKGRQPCGWYSSRWCRSRLWGSLFLTGKSQRAFCHMLYSKHTVTHRGRARSTAHLQADSAVHAQWVWHIQMLHRLHICKGHLYCSSQAVEHPEIRNGYAAFGSVNGRRDGGAPFYFPIKSPPALSQGDKSTALFPQDAFSGCEFVAGDVLCAEQFFFS